MRIQYKTPMNIRRLWEEYGFIIVLIGILLLLFGLIFGKIYLEEDRTKIEDIKNICKTTIVIKKENGLTDEYIISSNGKLSFDGPGSEKTLIIEENGINAIGCEITNTVRVENVSSYYIKK